MSVLAFNLQKNQIRYAVLEGSKSNPTYITGDRLTNNNYRDTAELMDWCRSTFLALIDRHTPSLVSYRLFWKTNNMEQAKNFHYPYGVLNLICFEKNITVSELSSQKIKNPKTLGLPKDTDLYQLCDERFPSASPKDKPQKDTILTAWFSLE